MTRKFLAGVANVAMFVGDNLIANATTLIDSTFSITASAEDVRGGNGNQLFGKYFHTSAFDITLTDTLFNLDYIALQTGSEVAQGAEMFETENATITANKGNMVGVPANGIAWVSPAGANEWTKVTVTAGSFDYQAADGTAVCIKYFGNDINAHSIKISSNIIPSEVKLVMTANLYKAGTDKNTLNASSRIGTIDVVVPRFLFSGNMEFSMTSSGVATTPLSGSALAVEDVSCENGGYYAVINEKISNANVFDTVIALAVEGGSISMKVGATKPLTVYGIKRIGAPFIIPNDKLTFTSETPDIATVGTNTGVVTAVATGNTDVTVVITGKPEITAQAEIKVTA